MVIRRRAVLGGIVGLALAAGLYSRSRGDSPAPAAGTAASSGRPAEESVPRIDLGRLESRRVAGGLGERDIFDFGTPPPTAAPPPPPSSLASIATPPATAQTPPPMSPLGVKYIGTLEDRRGLKVAFFLTDGKEVVTGQTGQVVANRYRILRIGVESVDIQEVGSGQVRRLPFRGN